MPMLPPNRLRKATRVVPPGAIFVGIAATAAALVPLACKRDAGSRVYADAAASASAAASAIDKAKGVELPLEVIAKQINPGGLAPYEGPFGSVTGKITVKGDPPPVLPGPRPPAKRCGEESRAIVDRLFRVGPAGELADAVIGVTDYKAFVPAEAPAVDLSIRGCAFDRRTVAITYGQRIDVKNDDPTERYLPHLNGAQATALMVAMPQGDAAPLLPPLPGPYTLTDDLMHPWMSARVLVLKFSTFAVSTAQGDYRIGRVPVGSVKVSVRHPEINETLERTVTIEDGKNTVVNFEITYKTPAAPASASGSARAPAPAIH